MMKYILPFLLAACSPIPVQIAKQSQEQSQSQSMQSSNDAAAQSSHASDSKQGLSSQPIIIICNSANSPNAVCSPFETAKDVFQPKGVSK